ncbi:MAG: PqqD family protein [Ruminococcaceae bacterium]|nr:PqqD family protein [Oscillospiraceae bacterium]
MKIKEGFVLKAVAGSHLVVPLGSHVVDFASIIKLSDTGAFLWAQLNDDKTKEDLVTALTAEYDVDTDTASKDIDKFIQKLKEADLIE